jgi:integrase
VYTPDEVFRIATGAGSRWQPKPGEDGVEVLASVRAGMSQAGALGEYQEASAARDMTMIVTMAFTGVRLGELLALRWEDIEADWKWLRVDRQVKPARDAATRRSGLEVAPTKGKRHRSVPILEPVRLGLEWLHSTMGEPSQGWIFANRTGGHLQPHVWRNRHFKPAARRAPDSIDTLHERVEDEAENVHGFPNALPHDMRHTFASLMIARGVTPLRLASWLGHSDVMTTMRTYAHLFDRIEDDIVRKVNEDLFS